MPIELKTVCLDHNIPPLLTRGTPLLITSFLPHQPNRHNLVSHFIANFEIRYPFYIQTQEHRERGERVRRSLVPSSAQQSVSEVDESTFARAQILPNDKFPCGFPHLFN